MGLLEPPERPQGHLVSQALSRGEAKDSILLSSRDGYLLEPTKWPKGLLTLDNQVLFIFKAFVCFLASLFIFTLSAVHSLLVLAFLF